MVSTEFFLKKNRSSYERNEIDAVYCGVMVRYFSLSYCSVTYSAGTPVNEKVHRKDTV